MFARKGKGDALCPIEKGVDERRGRLPVSQGVLGNLSGGFLNWNIDSAVVFQSRWRMAFDGG
jgi:hypothetical protein